MATRRPGSAQLVRETNDRIALELLLTHRSLTRAQLCELTGLSTQTASQLFERLLHGGLVSTVTTSTTSSAEPSRRGPNAQAYAVGVQVTVAGVEVRDGRIRAAVADLWGEILGRSEQDIDAGEPAHLVSRAVRAAARDAGRRTDDLHALLVGTPGSVDPGTGDVGYAWDLPHWRARLRTGLSAEVPCPVLLENEVNLAGVAEHRIGAASDRDTFCLLSLGHGVGAAVILDQELFRGVGGGAGELGYLPVPGAPVGRLHDPVGSFDGGVQALLGAAAVRELASSHGLRSGSAITAVAEACDATDPRSTAFVDALADRLALAAAALCAVLDPGVVVLGGEIGRAGGAVLARRTAGSLRTLTPFAADVRASTTEDASLYGGVLTAVDHAKQALLATLSPSDGRPG